MPGGSGAADTYNRTSSDGWWAGGVATLFSAVTDPVPPGGIPAGTGNQFFASTGSDHVGGCFFAMTAGSVRFSSEFVDTKGNVSVFPLLGSIRDGDMASLEMAAN